MKKIIYTILLVALCSSILTVTVPDAHAEFRENGVAFIDAKGPNALMFDGHGFKRFDDRYMLVSNRTRFYDENEVQISLADLKIPCLAKILYREKASSTAPEAISVHVEHYGEGTVDTKFTLPVMKPEASK